MESPDTEDNAVPLNANRTVTRDDATPPAASMSRATAPVVGERTQALDWKRLWPWLLAAVVLVLIVWLLTRKGRSAPSVA